MTVADIEQRIAEFVQQDLLRDDASSDLAYDEDLLMSGRIDSMGIMRLIGFVESEYGIAVPPEDVTIDHFYSVQSIANYIDKRNEG